MQTHVHTQTLPALVQLVQHKDIAVKIDACWALSFLAEGKDRQIQVGCYMCLFEGTTLIGCFVRLFVVYVQQSYIWFS